MDTVTRLVANGGDAWELGTRLLEAARAIQFGGEDLCVEATLEQADSKGPWRLVITVVGEND